MNVYLKTLAGDTFAVGMTDLEAIAAAEASGVRVCPPGLLADGGLGDDTTIDQLRLRGGHIDISAGAARSSLKRLEDTRTLRHYGIRAESTVHLIYKVHHTAARGGDPELPSVLDDKGAARLHAAAAR